MRKPERLYGPATLFAAVVITSGVTALAALLLTPSAPPLSLKADPVSSQARQSAPQPRPEAWCPARMNGRPLVRGVYREQDLEEPVLACFYEALEEPAGRSNE